MPEITENDVEKGFTSQKLQAAERAAHVISLVANPLFLALPLFLLVALRTAPNLLRSLEWWIIIAGGFTAAPFLFIRNGVKEGKYSDSHVSKREQRLIPLSFGFICMVLVFLLLFLLKAAVPLLASIIAALLSLLIALLVTQLRFKISLHMVGITGSVTICCLLFGPTFLLLSPLVALVGWARWKVHAHTPIQACAGMLLAVAITLAVFWGAHLL